MTGNLIPASYAAYVPSTRKGRFFAVHPYPTKINPEAIIPFIKAHASPGDTIYDPFAGSCSVGAAVAVLANEPDAPGPPRRAICNDLGQLPSWIGKTAFCAGESSIFEDLAMRALDEIERALPTLYGRGNSLRNAIWSDYVECQTCQHNLCFFDFFLDRDYGSFNDAALCPKCGGSVPASAARVMSNEWDPVIGETRAAVRRDPVRIVDDHEYGNPWGRPPTEDDLAAIQRAQTELERCADLVPVAPLSGRWDDMQRSGYHAGISHVHHFYTPRNLVALSHIFQATRQLPAPFDDLLRLAASSYNAAHSTLMTRFVFKAGQNRPVITSAQPGALYIGHCPVEKNVFRGVRTKVRAIAAYMDELGTAGKYVTVQQGPAQNSGLDDDSVDYIFTDPPFGGNIQYAALASISEAWLGEFTDASAEAIMSRSQGKGIDEYQQMLTDVFADCYRILKPGGAMTIVFHSTSKAVWNALQQAVADADFITVDTTILDKLQGSFKQVTTKGAVSKDPVLTAIKPLDGTTVNSTGNEVPPGIRRAKQYAYSEYIAECLLNGRPVDLDAKEFRARMEDAIDAAS